jgi:hypothetical protein
MEYGGSDLKRKTVDSYSGSEFDDSTKKLKTQDQSMLIPTKIHRIIAKHNIVLKSQNTFIPLNTNINKRPC